MLRASRIFFTVFFALRGGMCLIGARLEFDWGLQCDRRA